MIQAVFERVARKPGCNMFKATVDGKSQWVHCPQNVKNFAGKAFQSGQPISMDATFANNHYTATRVTSVDGGQPEQTPPQVQQAVNPPPQQYSQPAQVQNTHVPQAQVSNSGLRAPSKYRDPVTPEESDRMCRLSVLSSVSQAVSTLQGQVDVNTIGDVMLSLYDKCLAKIKE